MRKLLLNSALFFSIFCFILPTDQLHANQGLNDGLVAYYPFNGNVNDESGNGHKSVLYGAILTDDRYGNSQQAYYFDGKDDYIYVPGCWVLNNTGEISITAWAKAYSTGLIAYNGCKGEIGLNVSGPGIHLNNYAWLGASNGFQTPSNNWHHFAGVWKRGEYIKAYVDGVEVASETVSSHQIINGDGYHWTAIGRYGHTTDIHSFFKGKLDEIRIYNRVLSEEEIRFLSEQKSKIAKPTVYYTKSTLATGESLLISGYDFTPQKNILLYLYDLKNNKQYLNDDISVDADGHFIHRLTIPESIKKSGYYGIVLVNGDGVYKRKILVLANKNEDWDNSIEIHYPFSSCKLNADEIYSIQFIQINPPAPIEAQIQVDDPIKYEVKYKVSYSLDNGNIYREFGTVKEFVNRNEIVRVKYHGFKIKSDVDLIDKVLIKISDEYHPEISAISEPFSLKNVPEKQLSCNLKWDYSYQDNMGRCRGVVADGVSRIYLQLDNIKNKANVEYINLKLYDLNISEGTPLFLGKLMPASITSKYSDEAKNAILTEINDDRKVIWTQKYWYVAPDDFNDLNNYYADNSEREVSVKVTINYKNGEVIEESFPITVVRPPVVLGHGIGMDGSMWNDFGIIRDNRFKEILAVDYLPNSSFVTNALKLVKTNIDENNKITDGFITQAIKSIRKQGYACNQVDYIGYSMGGVILREAVQSTNFNNEENYQRGYINKFISIDVPHAGSPLADVLCRMFKLDGNNSAPDYNLLLQLALIKASDFVYTFFDVTYVPLSFWSTELPVKVPMFSIADATKNLRVAIDPDNGGRKFGSATLKTHFIFSDYFPGDQDNNSEINEEYFNDASPFETEMLNKLNNLNDFIIDRIIFGKAYDSWEKHRVTLTEEAIIVIYDLKNNIKEVRKTFERNSGEEQNVKISNIYKITDAILTIAFILSSDFETSSFLLESDIIVGVKSQVSNGSKYAPNATPFNGKSHTSPFIYPIIENTYPKLDNLIISLLNTPINSDKFGYPNATKQFAKERIKNPTLSEPISQNNENISFFTDTNRLQILSPIINQTLTCDSLINISLFVQDTTNLLSLRVYFQDEVFRIGDFDDEFSLYHQMEPFTNGNDEIVALGLYEAGDSVYYLIDKVKSIYNINDSLQRINSDKSYISLNGEDYERVVFNAIYTRSIVDISSDHPELKINIQDSNIVRFNPITSVFYSIENGSTSAIIEYKNKKDTVYLNVSGVFDTGHLGCTLLNPENESIVSKPIVDFIWRKNHLGYSYDLMISENSDFRDTVFIINYIADTVYSDNSLDPHRDYYWKVRLNTNLSKYNATWSDIWKFSLKEREPDIQENTKSAIVCKGKDHLFYVELSGDSLENEMIFQYQWQKDDKDLGVPGSNSSSFALMDCDFSNSGLYRCRITNYPSKDTVFSDPILLYVSGPASITESPKTKYVRKGSSVRFGFKTHIPEITGANTSFIQWYRGNQKMHDNDRISGSTSSTLSITNVTEIDTASNYFVKIIDPCAVDSETGIAYINSKKFGLRLTDIKIIQPSDIAICQGKTGKITIEFENTLPSKKLEFQWYKDNKPLEEKERIQGTRTQELSINKAYLTDLGDYYLEIYFPDKEIRIVSDIIKVSINAKPLITKQSEQLILREIGDSLELEVVTDSKLPVKYSWYQNGSILNNELLNSIRIESIEEKHFGEYYCLVSNDCDTIKSIVFYVTDRSSSNIPPKIIKHPEAITNLSLNEKLNIFVIAEGSQILKYQWEKNGKIVTGHTSYDYIIDQVSKSDQGVYRCKVWNEHGEIISNYATVHVITTTVDRIRRLDDYELWQNEPNPFNNQTTIKYYVPRPSFIKIAVYDMLGNERAVLVDGLMSVGLKEIQFHPNSFSLGAGIYQYILSTQNIVLARKLVIIK
jgi:concanavalin A-like lectin/glucanase superfamily protein/Ig-like domain-containing protein/palmitoyl protein thioesterase